MIEVEAIDKGLGIAVILFAVIVFSIWIIIVTCGKEKDPGWPAWNMGDSRKNMKLFDKELKRLHKLLLSEVDYDIHKSGIEDEINKIHDHMLTVSKRIAGLEY